MKKIFFTFCVLFMSNVGFAQYESNIAIIKNSPKNYSGESVLLRMIEGAGFRYYWATEGMKDIDIAVIPCEECRSSSETVEHIYSLSAMVKSTVLGEVFDRSKLLKDRPFQEYIQATNDNWVAAANHLIAGKGEIAQMQIDFGNSQVPFWNLLNGPLADAIYHTGQLIIFRRMSGNPINPKVNVFMGKLND